jgi:hypothetical protein
MNRYGINSGTIASNCSWLAGWRNFDKTGLYLPNWSAANDAEIWRVHGSFHANCKLLKVGMVRKELRQELRREVRARCAPW